MNKDTRIHGYFSEPNVFPEQTVLEHCIRVVSTSISEGVYKCSVTSYTITDPEREDYVALFHDPSITNEFCPVLCTLNPCVVGPCHHGMARPQVADRGTASNMEGSCE